MTEEDYANGEGGMELTEQDERPPMSQAKEIALRSERCYREIHGIPENRCVLCGWTLAGSLGDGCVPGNCAYRPGGSEQGSRLSKIRAELAVVAAALESFVREERGRILAIVRSYNGANWRRDIAARIREGK